MNRDRELLKRLAKIDTPTLSNAIERLGVRNRTSGFCHRAMRDLTPELGVLCGRAVTAQAVTMHPDAGDRRRCVELRLELCDALGRLEAPGVVVIQEVGPHPEYSVHAGDVMATLFRRFGAIGLVSDGALRDVAEVRATGFHFFAPGTVASHATFRLVAVQLPVTVCGLRVNPGDVIHGDQSGLMSVPEEGIDRLEELVAGVREREKAMLDYLNGEDVSREGILELMG
jgi:4-hydroxy-4-methyl-2-oxoglutarate aldolase